MVLGTGDWSDLCVSAAVLVSAVLLSEVIRRAAARLPRGAHQTYLLEAASTFQLCCCSHELKLLGDHGGLDPLLGPVLTYSISVTHLLTFAGASCNPCAALESVFRGSGSLAAAGGAIACQFGAAVGAQLFATCVWSLGLSDLHRGHRRFGFWCFDPLGGTLLEATAAELACAFTFQAALMHVHSLNPKVRVHALAVLITILVYSGGGISGAIFNPVLAFSVQFPCSGHTYLEYCFVYWLGPVLGVTSCILLFEKIIPFLSGKSTVRPDVPLVQKQKVQ
ncbi:aquaporin-11-like [Thalassophryne amazonica]|uniref:aquaporin-11-like n=1 Tax=Thalassophryne amazonica TaxID=390379 RepID=UPI0014714D42|nr:aquaporin-11-like [Thalassophryne amazonica]